MSQRRIGVIGAGPAGIMAALEAARLGAEVLLFDTNAIVGRKLLVTGNGRCNISNLNASAERYACDDPQGLAHILDVCGPRVVLERLADLGVLTYATADGWCYPLSESAAAVVDALKVALDLAGVQTRLQTLVADLFPTDEGIALVVGGGENVVTVDRAIVATGGKAYPALGSKGRFFPVLERLGHTILPVLPALTAIEADMRRLHKLQGVRMDVGLALYAREGLLGRSVGNVLFTAQGLSGPGAMDLSHLVSLHLGELLTLGIDFLAAHRQAFLAFLDRKRYDPLPIRILLGAVMPVKVPPVLLGLAGIDPDLPLASLQDATLEALLALLTDVRVPVKGTRGFQFAQLSTGGVPLAEIDPHTMASCRVPGLYLAGEVLNVIGPCGGYNLQFAWASGMLAGRSAAL